MPRTSPVALVGLLVTASWCGAIPALSQGSASEALREADRGTFASADLNGDGKITRPEHVHFTDLVFLSIDGAGDGAVTLEEFLSWDTGYVYAAEKMNKAEAVNRAKEAVFEELDLNGDGPSTMARCRLPASTFSTAPTSTRAALWIRKSSPRSFAS